MTILSRESTGTGAMGYGDAEFMAHRVGCLMCKSSTGYVGPASYRPHTGASDCWCCKPYSRKFCLIDIPDWRDLTPVTYIG